MLKFLRKINNVIVGALMVGAGGMLTVETAQAAEGDSPWLIRGRAVWVQPDESASISAIGGDADIDASVVPELDITYFFTDNIAAELILAVTPHDVTATGTALGNVDLGDVLLLPPILLAQYHFIPDGQFRPYVGAGINYTIFFSEDAPGGTVTNIDYDNSVGWALQAGVDYDLGNGWLLNADVKKLFLSTDVSINNGAILADVDIDPWLIGFGVGYRF